jgi:hypothetical protein
MRKSKVDEKVLESRKAAYKAKKHKADKWYRVTDGVAVKIPEPQDDARKAQDCIRAPNEEAAIVKMTARLLRCGLLASVVDVA